MERVKGSAREDGKGHVGGAQRTWESDEALCMVL